MGSDIVLARLRPSRAPGRAEPCLECELPGSKLQVSSLSLAPAVALKAPPCHVAVELSRAMALCWAPGRWSDDKVMSQGEF